MVPGVSSGICDKPQNSQWAWAHVELVLLASLGVWPQDVFPGLVQTASVVLPLVSACMLMVVIWRPSQSTEEQPQGRDPAVHPWP